MAITTSPALTKKRRAKIFGRDGIMAPFKQKVGEVGLPRSGLRQGKVDRRTKRHSGIVVS
jgi:hypothetical protein